MSVPAALASEALMMKSKLYIQRALARKDQGELDEYQLWASLALELLGKSALSTLHPSLVADPQHPESLFAAAGKSITTDVKTIAAHTLYARLGNLTPRFDKTVAEFCTEISQRRNAELHSGDVPFRVMRLEAWEAKFWHASDVILAIMDRTLDSWIGADHAAAPRALLDHANAARRDAVKLRIEAAKAAFNKCKSSERKAALADAKARSSIHYNDLFVSAGDAVWETCCPACSAKAYSTGDQISEEISQENDEYPSLWEVVERTYSPEEFRCVVCDLRLRGHDEMEVASLGEYHLEIEEREMEYEPEYGND